MRFAAFLVACFLFAHLGFSGPSTFRGEDTVAANGGGAPDSAEGKLDEDDTSMVAASQGQTVVAMVDEGETADDVAEEVEGMTEHASGQLPWASRALGRCRCHKRKCKCHQKRRKSKKECHKHKCGKEDSGSSGSSGGGGGGGGGGAGGSIVILPPAGAPPPVSGGGSPPVSGESPPGTGGGDRPAPDTTVNIECNFTPTIIAAAGSADTISIRDFVSFEDPSGNTPPNALLELLEIIIPADILESFPDINLEDIGSGDNEALRLGEQFRSLHSPTDV